MKINNVSLDGRVMRCCYLGWAMRPHLLFNINKREDCFFMAEGLRSLPVHLWKARRKRDLQSLCSFGYTRPLLNGPATVPCSLLRPHSSAGTLIHSLHRRKKWTGISLFHCGCRVWVEVRWTTIIYSQAIENVPILTGPTRVIVWCGLTVQAQITGLSPLCVSWVGENVPHRMHHGLGDLLSPLDLC
jgi:hypothetical protein